MFNTHLMRAHRWVVLSVCVAAGLAACGGDSTPSSTITVSACQGKALVGTRMSCPPSASASSSL